MPSHSRPAWVCDVMSRNVIQVNDEDSVEFAINLFDRCHISGAPVINSQGDYVGVVTRTDLSGRKVLEWVNNDCHLDSMLIREVMSFPKLITLPESSEVVDAVRLMLSQKIHRVFVTNDTGKIVGVISSFDVMKAVELNSETLKNNPHTKTHIKTPTENKKQANEPEKSDEEPQSSQRLNELEQRVQELIIRKRQSFQEAASEKAASEN